MIILIISLLWTYIILDECLQALPLLYKAYGSLSFQISLICFLAVFIHIQLGQNTSDSWDKFWSIGKKITLGTASYLVHCMRNFEHLLDWLNISHYDLSGKYPIEFKVRRYKVLVKDWIEWYQATLSLHERILESWFRFYILRCTCMCILYHRHGEH